MRYLGDIATGSTLRGSFNTRRSDGTPITISGTPALSVYKDGSTTESTAGVTLTTDFDSRTGHHLFSIDTSADGTFYSSGSDFRVVITAGTVDGISVVGTEVASFSLQNRTTLLAAGVRSALGLASANLDSQLSGIPAAVWASGTRTLSSFGTLASDTATAVWEAATRTLTSFGSLATDVWSAATRTITGGTISTVSDKTGYSLTQAFPTNFSSLAITGAGAVTAGTVSDKTGYSLTQSFPANFSSLAITVGGAVTAGTVSDKTGYSLTQTFPANFASMSIDASGRTLLQPTQTGVTIPTVTSVTNGVTVATNNDKAGYSLSQAFPTNFASLAITVGGSVTAGTVSDKSGYSLSTPPPTATAIASQVRTELTTELARIDVATSTRLASGSYTSPDNASIAAIKAKTDTIPSWPTNFASLAIDVTGRVTIGTNADKTGYSLSQAFPTNFAAMSLDGSGRVLLQPTQTGVTIPTVTSVTNYTAPDNSSIALIKAKTDNLPATFPTNFSALVVNGSGHVMLSDGSITAAKIGTDAINASKVASDVSAEIAAQVRTELTTELARIDVATSTRLNAGSYIAPDNAGISSVNALATQINSTANSISQVTDKLNTAMEQDGPVYRFTGNALELAPTTLPAGSGARTVTITTNLSGQPLQGALVRISKMSETYTQITDSNGRCTFNINDGTWTVAITATGAIFNGASLVVDSDETATYSLTAVSIPASDVGKRTVYYTCLDNDGSPLVNTTVYAKCIKAPGAGLAIMGTSRSTTSNNIGVASFINCIIGATYEFSMGGGRKINATIPPGTSAVALDSIVGQ